MNLDRVSAEVLLQDKKLYSTAEESTEKAPSNGVKEDNWLKKHPVLFGVIAGFFGGTIIGLTTAHEDLTQGGVVIIYGSIGIGIGALVGKVASGF